PLRSKTAAGLRAARAWVPSTAWRRGQPALARNTFQIGQNIFEHRSNLSPVLDMPAKRITQQSLVSERARRGRGSTGIERLRRRDAAQAAVCEAWLTVLRGDYADRILPVTAEIAEE